MTDATGLSPRRVMSWVRTQSMPCKLPKVTPNRAKSRRPSRGSTGRCRRHVVRSPRASRSRAAFLRTAQQPARRAPFSTPRAAANGPVVDACRPSWSRRRRCRRMRRAPIVQCVGERRLRPRRTVRRGQRVVLVKDACGSRGSSELVEVGDIVDLDVRQSERRLLE